MPLVFSYCKELDCIVKRYMDITPSQHSDSLGEHLGLPFVHIFRGRRGRQRWQADDCGGRGRPRAYLNCRCCRKMPRHQNWNRPGEDIIRSLLFWGRKGFCWGWCPAFRFVTFKQHTSSADANRGTETKCH